MACLMLACGSNSRAPVGERIHYAPSKSAYHIVRKGESLYSIAWLYGYDFQTLARWNGIRPPYTIFVGQRLRVKPPASGPQTAFRQKNERPPPPQPVKPPAGSSARAASDNAASVKPHPQLGQTAAIRFSWPVKGPVIKNFDSINGGKTGIGIGGSSGATVRAAADGKVVYAGSGLVGYGRLIIIKHNKIYLSAYGHNQKILVKEGDWVRRGQAIATMGSSGTNRVMLHFEIRRYGKPVDPVKYLPRR